MAPSAGDALRRFGLAAALALTLTPVAAPAAEIRDATGRTVAIPEAATRVFPAGPPASVLLCVLKPEAMLGWTRAPRERDRRYLPASARDLPELPPLTLDGDAVNLAGIAAADPELILDFGSVTPRYVAQAERVAAESGAPTVLLDGSLDATPAALRDLGAALGAPERGEALAGYAEATLALVDATLARVPEEERPRVYLARGPDGLQSGGATSINAEAIGRVGAVNVVADDGGGNLVEVTPEAIAAWAPEVILTQDAGFAAAAAGDPVWRDVPAVAEGRVLVAPSAPFGFIDAPPSVNRLIGLRWLLHALYPEAADGDLRAEVREFYRLFYQVGLDDAALDGLLGG